MDIPDTFKPSVNSKNLFMATTPRSSQTITSILFIVTIVCLTLSSCTSGDHGDPKDEVCIPVPKDTSALGKIDHYIPKATIEKFKTLYDSERDTLARKVPNLSMTYSEAFNKRQLLDLLKDPRCVGLRIYYGMKTAQKGQENQLRLMIVGVDAQGKDLYWKRGTPAAAQAGDDEHEGGLEYGQCNPPCNIGDDGR
jgi:hypothetical protein